MNSNRKRDKSGRITLLRQQYEAFLEEDRNRRERNEYILHRLDNMRSATAVLQANTHMGKQLKANETAGNFADMPQSTVQGFVRQFRMHIPPGDTNDYLPPPYQNQMLIPKHIAPNTEGNIEQTILREISKKYILIPKLTSSLKDNGITQANYQPEQGPQAKPTLDDKWKSKYDILEKLSSINDEDDGLDVLKEHTEGKYKKDTTGYNYRKYLNYSNKEQEDDCSGIKQHIDRPFADLKKTQDSLLCEEKHNSTEDIVGTGEKEKGAPVLKKSSDQNLYNANTSKKITTILSENVGANIKINDEVTNKIESVNIGQNYNRTPISPTAVTSDIDNDANAYQNHHPYKTNIPTSDTYKPETSSIGIVEKQDDSIKTLNMSFDITPQTEKMHGSFKEPNINIESSTYDNVKNHDIKVNPQKYHFETENQVTTPETNKAENADTTNYLRSEYPSDETQYTKELPQNQGYTQDLQQNEDPTQEQVYSQENVYHDAPHQTTVEYNENQQVHKETPNHNNTQLNEQLYEQNAIQEHALTYPQEVSQEYDQNNGQVVDLQYTPSENPPTDLQGSADLVGYTQPYQTDQGWSEQNVAGIEQPILDAQEYLQADQHIAEIPQEAYSNQADENAYYNQTAYPEGQYEYDQNTVPEVVEYNQNEAYDQTSVLEGTEQIYDQNQGYDQTAVPEGTGQHYDQTESYDNATVPQSDQGYEQHYALNPNEVDQVAEIGDLPLDPNYNQGYDGYVQEDGVIPQESEVQDHVEQQHIDGNQKQYEYTEQPVENTNAQ